MRLTLVVDSLPAQARDWAETTGMLLALLVLVLLLRPAIEYVGHESFITTAALGISNSWRVAAIATGCSLMILFLCLRLYKESTVVRTVGGLLVVAALAGVLYSGNEALRAMGNLNLLVFFGVITLVALMLGVPIAFAFALATIAYLIGATRVPLLVVVGRIEEGMSHQILLAVPLFIFLGVLMELAGLARAMVGFLGALVGHVKGGLSYVLLGAMYLVSGISGAKVADMAAVAPVLFPEMKARGQKPGEMVALLATSGAMAETIPPSLVLITLGSVAGVSIAALFTGGLLPAVVLALALGCVAFFRSRNDDLTGVEKMPAAKVIRLLWIALPALSLPVLIRGAVMEGVATATEVSTLGIVYTVFLGVFVYHQFDWSRVYGMLVATASLSGAILFVIGAATAMAWGLTQSGFSRQLAQFMTQIPGGAAGFMAISIVAFIVLGSVLEGIPALVLLAPLVFPIARSFGIHDVQYAMVVILSMGIGLFAPPVGVGFYIACAIGKVPPAEAIRPSIPYIIALIAGLVLVASIPWISIGFL